MKKYIKPELFYERYELSRNIAACAWDLNHANEFECGFKGDDLGLTGWVILAEAGRGCVITGYVEYCYQGNGPDNMNTFNS